MWCNDRKFRTKKLDDKKKTFDCGIIAVFQVTNVSSRSDWHPEVSENGNTMGIWVIYLIVTLNLLN